MTSPNAIEQLSKGKETIDTGMLCPECFGSIYKVVLDSPYLLCHCDCYARCFDDPQRVQQLNAKPWLDFILRSAGRKCCAAIQENPEILNPSHCPNYDCWCPHCERDRKTDAQFLWLSIEETYVGIYGACSECAWHLNTLPPERATTAINLCEERLLSRYPFLQGRLPKEST